MKWTPNFFAGLCIFMACSSSQSDDVLISKDGVQIVWRTSQFWQMQGGHNPIPERKTSEDQLLIWDEHEVGAWDFVDAQEEWSRDDKLELNVKGSVATYRRNGKAWWAVYRGKTALFHGPGPVFLDNVPTLQDIRAEIYRRQLRPDLRELIMTDAWADGEEVMVNLLQATIEADVPARAPDTHWADAHAKLSDSDKQKVNQALLAAYKIQAQYPVILRASTHLEFGDPELDAANRAALQELERLTAEIGDNLDTWPKRLLKQLACSKAFEDERVVVKVICPTKEDRGDFDQQSK